MHFPHLFQEGNIGACALRNRLIMSLYPTKYATDSRINERMIGFYQERARGGVAMIVLDCPCLDYPRAYKGPQELRFDAPEFAAGIRSLLDTIHAEGVRAFMQLNYPKERTFNHQVVGAKQKGNAWAAPLIRVMTADEAPELVQIMAQGAKKARELGYDGIEIQASYGDFISQLLSPLTNKRTDAYGGSLENRARFLMDLIKAVKSEAGNDCPVMVKLVCDEFVEGGLTLGEATRIAELAAGSGADAIFASGGNKATKGMTIPSHYKPPGALVHLARGIRKAVGIPVIAVGKINTPELADRIIREGDADFVAMARALLADPFFPEKARTGMTEDIRLCLYDLEDCAEQGVKGIGRACTVNPFSGQEYRLKVTPPLHKKRVVVVGGGPAGLQCALLASERGHEVILYEKDESPGGQLRLASRAPFKEEMDEELKYLKHSIEKTRTKVVLSAAAAREEILAQKPDAVVLAIGSRPSLLPIPGINNAFVFDVRAVYERRLELGASIVVIGGGDIGCETADLVSDESRKVTIVEAADEVLKKLKEIPKEELLRRLKDKGVAIITRSKVTSIEKRKVTIVDDSGVKREIPADSIIVAIGSTPADSLYDALKDSVAEIHVIGDAKEPGNLGAALRSATEVGLKI